MNMKRALKINIILIAVIISYSLIAVRGDVLGGPLWLFIFMGLFNNGGWIYFQIPFIGIILLIIAICIRNKKILYAVALLCLYPNLILYIIELVHNRHNLVTPVLSMIPFFILTLIAFFFMQTPITEKT
jgi:hypothetical protein